MLAKIGVASTHLPVSTDQIIARDPIALGSDSGGAVAVALSTGSVVDSKAVT